MRSPTLTLLLLVAACSSRPSDAGPTPAPAPTPGDLVRLTLVADRDRVVPGAEIELAARLEIAQGWHIYWQNPGEAGLPTRATFTAPAGFVVGDVAYPGPETFRSAGGIVTYGYAGQTALFARVRAPAEPVARTEFSVRASWLACREHCVRGKGTATLSLPSPPGARATPAIDAIRARLPRPWSELAAEPTWTCANGERRMEVVVPGASGAELFPIEDGGVRLLGQSARPGEGRTVVQARFSADKAASPALRGALRVHRDGRVTFYAVDLPWPC